jgi:hypothetical protein
MIVDICKYVGEKQGDQIRRISSNCVCNYISVYILRPGVNPKIVDFRIERFSKQKKIFCFQYAPGFSFATPVA